MDQPTRPQYNVRIRELPTSERPRERLRDYGARSLSTAELLAIILRTGSGDLNVLNLATNLMAHHGGLSGLARLSFSDLVAEKGLGEAKAAELLATFELAARLKELAPDEKLSVRTPIDVYMLLGLEMAYLPQENLRVILVNSRNQVMAIKDLYRGTISGATVRISELFQEAVRQNAPAIVLVHNHPSGDPTPSPDDAVLTKEAVKAGKLLQIEVMDHIIIGQGKERFCSLKNMGLGGLEPS